MRTDTVVADSRLRCAVRNSKSLAACAPPPPPLPSPDANDGMHGLILRGLDSRAAAVRSRPKQSVRYEQYGKIALPIRNEP